MRVVCLPVVAILLVGCGAVAPQPKPPVEAEVEPQLPAIEWNPVGEQRTYDASNLWDAINGAADGYLAYGFVRLTIQDHTSDRARATLEIYDQGTPLNAFGVYRRDRPPDSTPIGVGAEALISPPHHCAMLAGANYVQARALEGELDEAGCRGLFATVLESLPGPHELPGELDLLPGTDRIPGSEGFTRESFLGVSDLRDCLHAEYRGTDATVFQVFAFIEKEGRDSAKVWSELASSWKPAGDEADPVLHRSVPYTGEVVVIRTDAGITGVAGAGDLATSVKKLRLLVGR